MKKAKPTKKKYQPGGQTGRTDKFEKDRKEIEKEMEDRKIAAINENRNLGTRTKKAGAIGDAVGSQIVKQAVSSGFNKKGGSVKSKKKKKK